MECSVLSWTIFRLVRRAPLSAIVRCHLESKEASFSASLLGRRCKRIQAIEHSFDGVVRNPYNAIFIETDDGASFRVLFDLDTFFCNSEPPRVWPSNGRNSYRLVEPQELCPVFGRLIRSVSFDANSGGGCRCLIVRFDGGGEFRYWNEEVGSRLVVDARSNT
jgi:hypothetical protein